MNAGLTFASVIATRLLAAVSKRTKFWAVYKGAAKDRPADKTYAEPHCTRRAMIATVPFSASLYLTTPACAAQVAESDIRAVLDRYVAAWSKGDIAGIIGCYHDEFTLHYFGSNALSGNHAGKVRALEVLKEFSRRTNRRLVAVNGVLAGAQYGAVIAREALGKGRDVFQVDRLFVFAVRDGLLTDCWIYDQDQRLIDSIIG